MVTFKTDKEIQVLRAGGKIIAKVLRALVKACKPGISAAQLDKLAEELILGHGARPAFKGYRPHGALKPFPGSICVSKNEVVVHGIPTSSLILERGDVVSLDLGIVYKKFVTDAAVSIGIGRIAPKAQKLLKVTQAALEKAIKVCRAGNTVGDIGSTIERYVKSRGFFVIKELVGHGVGYSIHEDPNVPNYGQPKSGQKLEPGMVLAIEPMVSIGVQGVFAREDGSFVTRDGNIAAHFEHTIAITKKGPIVLTK